MDKKKIFAIALFLLMAFFMFSYANPSSKVAAPVTTPEVDNNKEEEKVTEEVKEETTVVTPVISTHKVVEANTTPVINPTQQPVVVDYTAEKEAAKKALQKYADELDIKDIDSESEIITDGNKNIDDAKSLEEIQDSLTESESKLDALKKQEELDALKEELIDLLTNYNKDVIYVTDVDLIKNTGIENIKLSTTKEDAQNAYDKAIKAIDSLKVYLIKFIERNKEVSTVKAEEGVLFRNITPKVSTKNYTASNITYDNGKYVTDEKVSKDDIITVQYDITHIYANVYTLKDDVQMPVNSQVYTGSTNDYTKLSSVELNTTSDLKDIIEKGKKTIVSQKDIISFVKDKMPVYNGTLKDGYYNWYVMKYENDGFHIDGMPTAIAYSVQLNTFVDYTTNGGYEGYWFEMAFKDENNTTVDSSKIENIEVKAFDKAGQQIVYVYGKDKLKDSLKTGKALNNNVISGYANIDGVEKQSSSWAREFANIDGYVTVTKAVVTATLVNGKTITDTLDNLNVTRFVKFDTTAPVITLTGTENTTVELGTNYNELGAKATDLYDGSVEVKVIGNVDTTKEGTYTITYNATDKAGNSSSIDRTVIVEDTTAPTITLNGKDKITIKRYTANKYEEKGVTTNDLSGVEVTKEIKFTKPYSTNSVIVDNVNNEVVGTYEITYTATDGSKKRNSSSVTRTAVVDQLLNSDADMIVTPYINGEEMGLLNNTYEVEINTAMPLFTASVKDVINNKLFNITDENISKYLTIDSSKVDMTKVGSYTVKFTGFDWAGNARTIEKNVKVVDTIAPVTTLDDTKMVSTNVAGHTIMVPTASVTDNSNKQLTATVTDYTVDWDYSYTTREVEHRGLFGKKYTTIEYTYYKQEFITSVTFEANDEYNKSQKNYTFKNKVAVTSKEEIGIIEYTTGSLIWD